MKRRLEVVKAYLKEKKKNYGTQSDSKGVRKFHGNNVTQTERIRRKRQEGSLP